MATGSGLARMVADVAGVVAGLLGDGATAHSSPSTSRPQSLVAGWVVVGVGSVRTMNRNTGTAGSGHFVGGDLVADVLELFDGAVLVSGGQTRQRGGGIISSPSFGHLAVAVRPCRSGPTTLHSVMVCRNRRVSLGDGDPHRSAGRDELLRGSLARDIGGVAGVAADSDDARDSG
jgi:hypothetical protein